MVSRKDVAERAGVSSASVSYYVNKSGYVSEKAGKKIQKAIDELGYVPNQLASSLRRQQSRQFVFLCNEIRNPFYSQLISNATEEAAKKGYSILFSPVVDDDEYIKKVLAYQVSGIFASNKRLNRKLIESVVQRGIPTVLLRDIEWKDHDERISFIKIDFSNIFQEIVSHLKANGYNNICYVSSAISDSNLDLKTRYYIEASGNSNVIYGPANTQDAYRRVLEYLKDEKEIPDAFVCANDAVAFGVKKAVLEKGRRIPEDCAIVGFDNTNLSEYSFPAITSVDYSFERIGEKIIEMLLKKENGEKVEDYTITPRLLVRQSSRRI
jgi:Transcriptional regulators